MIDVFSVNQVVGFTCTYVCVCVCVLGGRVHPSPPPLRRAKRAGESLKTFLWSEGKAIPLQAWTGPEGSRRLRLPDFKTIGT